MRNLLLLLLLPISINIYAKSSECKQAINIYDKNRSEQRSGYSARRGNWLNCIEDKSNAAKRKYCRLSKSLDTKKYSSVKQEVITECRKDGISP
jgi:hypothetical protein